MSKARPQSQKRKMLRTLYGTQNGNLKTSKRPDLRLQVIHVSKVSEKKPGRKSNSVKLREKWLERLPFHLGSSKFIFHRQ